MTSIRLTAWAFAAVILAADMSSSFSAPPGCREEIDRVSKMVDDKREDYTAEARAEARRHLAAARTQVGQPADCRKKVREARQALRQGKQ